MVQDKVASAEIGALIGRIILRDRSAFDELYSRTSGKLYAVASHILADRAEAEEAVQETYIKIWRKADTFRPGVASPMSWLISIARNSSIDIYRRRRDMTADPEALSEEPDGAPSPEQVVAGRSDANRLHHCLGTLEEKKAQLIREAYFGGRTYREIAERVSAPLGSVKSWIRRGLMSLRDCLNTGGTGAGEGL